MGRGVARAAGQVRALLGWELAGMTDSNGISEGGSGAGLRVRNYGLAAVVVATLCSLAYLVYADGYRISGPRHPVVGVGTGYWATEIGGRPATWDAETGRWVPSGEKDLTVIEEGGEK